MTLLIYSLVLFAVVSVTGYAAFQILGVRQKKITGWLNFAGGYLFSVTIVHLIPELFQNTENGFILSVLVLGGFFFQQILEIISSGAEHGHIHTFDSGHSHKGNASILVVLSLSLHALLEGTILVEDPHESYSLLLSIALHKVPATIALVSILVCTTHQKWKIQLFILLFALSSPIGIWLSKTLIEPVYYPFAFALVCGSFLQISTTIVFESNTAHKFNSKKLIWSLIGAFLALLAYYFGI